MCLWSYKLVLLTNGKTFYTLIEWALNQQYENFTSAKNLKLIWWLYDCVMSVDKIFPVVNCNKARDTYQVFAFQLIGHCFMVQEKITLNTFATFMNWLYINELVPKALRVRRKDVKWTQIPNMNFSICDCDQFVFWEKTLDYGDVRSGVSLWVLLLKIIQLWKAIENKINFW